MTKSRKILDEYGSRLSYDSRGNLISRKFKDWGEEITEYDENNNKTYFKDSYETESWYKDGKLIHTKFSNGNEVFYDYNDKGELTHVKELNGEEWWYNSNGILIRDNVS